MKMSKLERKELIIRSLVISVVSIISVAAFAVYPQLSFVLPLGWIITGLGMILVYGLTEGIIYYLQWSGHQLGIIKDYLIDTYKLWKLL